MVPMPCPCCVCAAPIASSRRSPGMNVDTDRRTNAVLVARSRSHALVDIANRILRAIDIALSLVLSLEPSDLRLDESPVDLDRGARDVRRPVGQQERRHLPAFFR